jgi:hypothetical protein
MVFNFLHHLSETNLSTAGEILDDEIQAVGHQRISPDQLLAVTQRCIGCDGTERGSQLVLHVSNQGEALIRTERFCQQPAERLIRATAVFRTANERIKPGISPFSAFSTPRLAVETNGDPALFVCVDHGQPQVLSYHTVEWIAGDTVQPGGTQIDSGAMATFSPDPTTDALPCLQHQHPLTVCYQTLGASQPSQSCTNHESIDLMLWPGSDRSSTAQ